MHYLKSLFFNFLIVFFANHVLPGIDALDHTKLPHIGGDLIVAIVLGLLNSLIFPLLKFVNRVSFIKIAGLAVVINFVAYALLKVIPAGIQISTIEGYFLAAGLVTIGSCLTNYFEMKHAKCSSSGCEHSFHSSEEHKDQFR